MNEKQQVLNLTNICDGKLEAEFEEMYKDALRKISKGQKAKITINIEMLRVPDTDTIVELGYNIKSTLPAISRRAIGSYADDFTVDEGDKLSFKLSCPIMNRYIKDAIKSETDSIKSELTNYLLLAGTQE